MVAASDDRPPGVLGTERGRLIASSLFVGVVALLIGVFVGRAGSDDEPPTADATESTERSVTTTTERSGNTGTLPRVGQDDAASTAAPPSTRADRIDAPDGLDAVDEPDQIASVESVMEVTPELSGLAVEVVVLTGSGEIVRVDAATGSTVRREAEGTQFGPPSIYAGEDWVLVPSYDPEQGGTVFFDDGRRTQVPSGTSWPVFISEETERLWRIEEPTEPDGTHLMVEVTILGEATGPQFPLTYFPQFVDPLGGMVVEAPGGSYRVGAGEAVRLSAGRLLALGSTVLVAEECDDNLGCGLVVVDRSTGVRRPLELGPEFAENTWIDAAGWSTFQLPFNEDEDALFIVAWDRFRGTEGANYGVLDLETGAYAPIGDRVDVPTMRWGPAGTHVFWIDRGRLMVFDRLTEESVLFSEDLGQISAFTLRLELPSVDASAEAAEG